MTEQIQQVATERVYGFLHSKPQGLTDEQVLERRREVGQNRLRVTPRLWWLRKLAKQFANFFTVLLLVSAGICFIGDRVQPGEGMAILGWALAGVAVLNAAFSFVQEFRAERAMQELGKFLPQQVQVVRQNEEEKVPAEDLVPGDVIMLHEGDKIPADSRVVNCEGLTISTAPLTGESQPAALRDGPVDASMTEADNIAFAGCAVLKGSAKAVVFATGARTEFGKIATLAHEIARTASPLQRETAHMVRVLTVIAVTMGLAFFIYGVVAGRPLWVNLVFMMGIIVANVPEGLLPTFTLALAMASLRMAKRNVLVRSLNAVEALGAVHAVCTDKTGTLTENRLTVSYLLDPISGREVDDDDHRIGILETAVVACDLERNGDDFTGDPLDVAVARRLSVHHPEHAAECLSRIRRKFPFDPDKRRSGGIAQRRGEVVFAVKGAWEAIKPLLSTSHGQMVEKDDRHDDPWAAADQTVHNYASKGYRVIAVACRSLQQLPDQTDDQSVFETHLTLKGLIALEDPIRPEVPDAVTRCHDAGIRVIMVTGDHADTAIAVARRSRIVPSDADVEVVTGVELQTMRERHLIDRIEAGVNIFARTTPQQKLKIVDALHEMDKVVAVTGDGVNDAPALRAADVGVAMGKTGTDVAREAAQVVLLDDNFASIVAGVEEGRTVSANIRKFTNYVLVSNGPEIIPFLLFVLLPVPLALTVIQILSIDLGTDIIPSMALGQEPPDPDVMKQSPRRRGAGILTRSMLLHSYGFLGLIEAAYSLLLFFCVLVEGGWRYGENLAANDPLYRSATGITLATIMLMQIGNLFGRRSRTGLGIDRTALGNRLLLLGVGLEVVFSWAILYFPPLSRILGTGPAPVGYYLLAWLGAPLIFGLDYLRKRIAQS